MLYCRLEEAGLRIEQCAYTIDLANRQGPTNVQASSIEVFIRQVGDNHTVGDLTFKISEIVVANDQKYPTAWGNISDPKITPPEESQ